MTTRVTVKGQVTVPKAVRDALGLKPGDEVEIRATADGALITKAPGVEAYLEKVLAVARRGLIKSNLTTEEMMIETRGDPALDPPLPDE